MRTRLIISMMFLSLIQSARAEQPPTTQPAIDWKPYSDEVFAHAKQDHKLIILDLEAVWCHWCHVQDEKTYGNPVVQKLINENYLAIKVDQDSRPDISNRYEDYGWPATIVFDSQGHEIVKRRGYLPPEQMESMLRAIIADPTPGPSIQTVREIHPATQPVLSASAIADLKTRYQTYYDEVKAGWGQGFKFVDADLVEYLTDQAVAGDKQAEHMVRQTLNANLKLIDPAWGGVYQYSTDGDWDHPHYEKIMSFQADDMRTYARAYAVWHDPQYLAAAEQIHHFLQNFLTSPDGAFYTSQDADRTPGIHGGEYFALDDAGRRRLGIPRIDEHIYARENGWAIRALVALHRDAGDATAVDEAIRAAKWILAHRTIEGGGFSHGEHDPAGPYLGDTLAMGRAFLDLYIATGDRAWLDHATSAATFIEHHFLPADPASHPGLLTAAVRAGDAFPPGCEIDENIAIVRFGTLLSSCTKNSNGQKLAESAMRYLAAPEIVATRNWEVGGLLLANQDMQKASIPKK